MANPYAPPTAAGIPVQPTFSDTTACAFAEPRQAVIHSLAACNVATAIFIPALIWQASAGYEPWALDAPLDKDPVFFRGAADVAVLSVGLLALLAYFTTVVLWAMWRVRANKNMRALRPDGHFTFTPGWTAGWFFVPIANLFKPYQAVKEMFVNSSTDGFSRMGVSAGGGVLGSLGML